MPLTTFTLDELQAIARGVLRGIPGANVAPGSDYDITARLAAALSEGNQSQAQYLAKQIFPATAEGEFLEQHARARGLTRAPAARAIGLVQVVGTGSPTQASGSALTHADGTAFVTTAPVTIGDPSISGKTCAGDCTPGRLIVSPNTTGMAAGEIIEVNGQQRAIKEVITAISAVDLYEPLASAPAAATAITGVVGGVVAIEASVTGAAGNQPIGETLTLSSPTSGITAACRVLELAGGGAAETDDELRARIIDYDASRPGGGNSEHIRTIARETPGVRLADALVFPSFRGLGTVDVVPIGLSGARRVSSGVADLVLAQLESLLPYTVDLDVSPFDYSAAEYDVDLTLTTELGYERDYVDSGRAIAVSPASTTTRVYLTTSLVGIAEVGDRVLVQVKSAGWWKTYQRTIASVQASGGNQWIDLDEELPVAPTSTDPNVHPGGPLAEAAIAAVESLFDALGPSRRNISPAWTWERHPLPAIAWDDTLRLSRIHASQLAIEGVQNVTIATPASDQQPSAKEVLHRGKITIRFTES